MGWLYDRTEVTLTVQDVANRLHQDMYGPESEHRAIHSCPCFNQARWFLGLDPKPRLYWPDGKGGNAHDPHPDPRIEFYRLQSAVVSAAVARRRAKLAQPNGVGRYIQLLPATIIAEDAAVDALIEFEAQHKIGVA